MPTDSFPFRVWSGLLAPEHYSRIGPALWTFLWLVRRTTREGREDGFGLVLGGKPVKARQIAQEIGRHVQAVKLDIARLRKWGYLRVERRTPYGLVMLVSKSKRWPERSSENNTSLPSERSSVNVLLHPREVAQTYQRSSVDVPAKKRVMEKQSKSESVGQINMTDSTAYAKIQTTPELKELGVPSLPASFDSFIQYAAGFKRRAEETLAAWGNRLFNACKKDGVRSPRCLLKCVNEAKLNAVEEQNAADKQMYERRKALTHEANLETYRGLVPGMPDKEERVRVAKDLGVSRKEFEAIELELKGRESVKTGITA